MYKWKEKWIKSYILTLTKAEAIISYRDSLKLFAAWVYSVKTVIAIIFKLLKRYTIHGSRIITRTPYGYFTIIIDTQF